ncbi:GNAT family N-acetyltransferase [Salinilacihabitans rarus]|uniref:GNAT family N-acetyltransferase n=1 Tax=Salinilacihabitans rarus TaxID=2961596 RepID=UPI0020C84F2E|nr:GNAT family N-acetyltransferase [Salinilacihabitans rarus]
MTRPIRPATTDDAASIRDVARESWHAAYDAFLGEETVEETIDEWYARDQLRESIADDGARVFVAEGASTLVGFVHAGPAREEPSVAHLVRLYVRPGMWGEGVGSALLERAETALREDGYDRLRLVVLADNEVGVSFYESRGFERIEARESGLREDLEEYVYEKGL